jgi:4-hydroxy-tetrahydrodipicolinate synthase
MRLIRAPHEFTKRMSDRLHARLKGSMTALATPFMGDDLADIDENRFAAFAAWQVAQGTRGLVVCGTTGENPVLSPRERDRLIRIAVESAMRRAVVIAGTGTNNTEETIALTRAARAAGADAALVVLPYYDKPTQRGVVAHFEAIAAGVDLPLIVYNVPSRNGLDLTSETVSRLAAIPSVIGIKDATGDPARPIATARAAGDCFVQLSGHDATALAFNLAGGRGCISVVANVVPAVCAALQAACARADWASAQQIQLRLMPQIQALEQETNPAPIKHALSLRLGWDARPRLPLVPVRRETAAAIEDALSNLEDTGPREDSGPALLNGWVDASL